MSYKETAPTLDGIGVTQTDVDAVELKETPAANTPELSKDKVLECLADFADIEKANGYLAIAHKRGMTMSQVKKLHKEFLASRTVVEE